MGLARIVAGDAKRRTLHVPEGVRPTSALTRRRILDSIEPLSRFRCVLDLYAGAGVLSAELLSRGVGRVIAVERSGRLASVWKKNLKQLGFKDRSEIMVKSVATALKRLSQSNETFDLVIADPPYASGEVDTVLSGFPWDHLLEDRALLIIEQSSREPAPHIEKLTQLWRKRIGDTGAYAFQLHLKV